MFPVGPNTFAKSYFSRRGKPLRNILAPSRINATENILEKNPSPLVVSRNTMPITTIVSPRIHAPIRWTIVGLGEPLHKNASTLRPFRTVSGKTIFRCLASRSSMK